MKTLNANRRRLRPAPAANSSQGPDILRTHIRPLDVVRGLAIVIVTCYRFRETGRDDVATDAARLLLDRAHHGVDLFLVLSGFLITGILYDTKERRDYLRRFFWRRGLRILPLYYVSLVLGLIVLPKVLSGSELAVANPPPDSPWLWFFGTNVIQSWRNAWCLVPFNHFWSLAVEEHFYLVWPFVIYWTTRFQAQVVSLACLGIGLVSRLVAIFAFDSPVAAEVFTLCRIDALGVGCWLALTVRGSGGLAALRTAWPWCVGLSLAAIAILFVLAKFATVEGSLPRDFLAALAFTPVSLLCAGILGFALTSASTGIASGFWNSRLLCLAGKYSYGWYVFQGLFIADFERYVARGLLASLADQFPLVAIALNILIGGGLSLGLAILSWHVLEQPVLQWKRAASGSQRWIGV